ncbi:MULTISPECIES: spermidine synthase [unclassified Flavobacterium]|nr:MULTISPECIES: fused MFS/spermidine synthase [unclassified Flavobacterium]MQP52306.1 methyltransferase domain-containing protein [Flavobacterium sp. LMO9]MQP62376.1 methyltransferase domain-containing protein [Flavobacterium sp. LMO6]
MVKRLMSFLLPIKIHEKKSKYNKNLEITWNNGYLVLDSENTNYSFGSLQRVLKKGLKYIGYERIKKFKSILVLGVAGGSVIETLKKEIKFEGKITGVEIDATVVDLANKYFGLNKYDNVEIVIDDAFEYVLKTKEKYDLIVIDIFQDTVMPNFLFEDFFINRINFLLNINGFILFNTMVLEFNDRRRNAIYKSKFESNYSVRLYPKIEEHNELFTIKKLS